MNSVSKVQSFFNNAHLSDTDELFIGIDTHKKTYHVALYLNDAPALDFVMPADPDPFIRQIKPVQRAIKGIVYEAGPTGYSLARLLQKYHLPVMVAAPSKTLRPSARENKTDRLDSKKLACYLAKGLLRPVPIPSIEQEADRQFCRIRHRQRRNVARVKIQIKSFLLQHGLPEPHGLRTWSIRSVDALRTLPLPKLLRLSLDALLHDLDYHTERLRAIEKTLHDATASTSIGQRTALLQTHPGVGVVAARQFVTELFCYDQFTTSCQVVKYIGLSPMVRQSGQKSTSGPINRDGKPALRSTLVQAAWRWVACDPLAKQYFWRICHHNGGIKQKAITAVARKLAVHLWTMLVRNEPYTAEKT